VSSKKRTQGGDILSAAHEEVGTLRDRQVDGPKSRGAAMAMSLPEKPSCHLRDRPAMSTACTAWDGPAQSMLSCAMQPLTVLLDVWVGRNLFMITQV
jgi:hypothetical protein